MFPLELDGREFVDNFLDRALGNYITPYEDVPVECPVILDDPSNVSADVADVRNCGASVVTTVVLFENFIKPLELVMEG